MAGKVVIVSGGSISSEFMKKAIEHYHPDQVIAVDKGLEVVFKIGLVPDYVVGDYDSVNPAILKEIQKQFENIGKPVIRTYQPEKDATDTEIAMTLALERQPESILVLGATGTRLDHTHANIQVLYQALEKGISAWIWDEHNRICLADRSFSIRKQEAYGDYVSLIPLTSRVEGVTLTGMKYPLKDATLVRGSSLGISNEIVAEEAHVLFQDGILLVFETKD